MTVDGDEDLVGYGVSFIVAVGDGGCGDRDACGTRERESPQSPETNIRFYVRTSFGFQRLSLTVTHPARVNPVPLIINAASPLQVGVRSIVSGSGALPQ